MTDGCGQSDWDRSAAAWIAAVGEHGDYTRTHILDPVMYQRIAGRGFTSALDVGCGEGRFCRMIREQGISTVGIDPTRALLERARHLDSSGDYRCARAEELPFPDEQFDLVISYLSLIDIADTERAIAEMTRVLKRGGTLLIANLTSFASAAAPGWVRDDTGRAIHCHPVDNYLEEWTEWFDWNGIRVRNWHRPLSTYMHLLLTQGLRLTFFDEPAAIDKDGERANEVRRRPWALVMEWRKD
jgi:SAM-dependent methyltransferase